MTGFDEKALSELILRRLRPPDPNKQTKAQLLASISKKLQQSGKVERK